MGDWNKLQIASKCDPSTPDKISFARFICWILNNSTTSKGGKKIRSLCVEK